MAALASCTCITVRMYADRKGWKLDDVTTNVKMERQVVSGVQQTKIVQELSFTGDLDDDQIARLLVISGKCPVHKTLSNSIAIENKLYVIS
ncbi:MAG: OsmC family protein [Bacteroidetes bacterium]|nr:OsmC family protein [Bacteroidota bacterium]